MPVHSSKCHTQHRRMTLRSLNTWGNSTGQYLRRGGTIRSTVLHYSRNLQNADYSQTLQTLVQTLWNNWNKM